jgi:hypothetical protein
MALDQVDVDAKEAEFEITGFSGSSRRSAPRSFGISSAITKTTFP